MLNGPAGVAIASRYGGYFSPRRCETAWNLLKTGEGWGVMGNSQGRDNVRKRAARRKKTERLAAAKAGKKKAAK